VQPSVQAPATTAAPISPTAEHSADPAPLRLDEPYDTRPYIEVGPYRSKTRDTGGTDSVCIFIGGGISYCRHMTPEEARQMAAQLLNCADAIDGDKIASLFAAAS
jgi:hypothetical protein